MALYAGILLLTALGLLGVSLAIYKGKTDLIHSYHQSKVTDPKAYGRAFGKALAVFALGPLLGGIAALAGGEGYSLWALAVFFGVGIGCIVAVQRKYNKGVF